MMTNRETASDEIEETPEGNRHPIELSCVHFFKGSLPPSLSLKDIVPTLVPDTVTALYGYQSKADGFKAAYEYAQKHGLNFTVIDITVEIARKQNPLVMKPDELSQFDFVSFQRLSKDMAKEVKEILSQAFPDTKISKPQTAFADDPGLLTALLKDERWQHLRIIATPMRTGFSNESLNLAVVPYRHWNSIKTAVCRLHPETTISLEPPEATQKLKSDAKDGVSPSVGVKVNRRVKT